MLKLIHECGVKSCVEDDHNGPRAVEAEVNERICKLMRSRTCEVEDKLLEDLSLVLVAGSLRIQVMILPKVSPGV